MVGHAIPDNTVRAFSHDILDIVLLGDIEGNLPGAAAPCGWHVGGCGGRCGWMGSIVLILGVCGVATLLR